MPSPTRQDASGNASGSDDNRRGAGDAPAGVVRAPTGLSREEEAYQENILEQFRVELQEELAREYRGDERQIKLALDNSMAQARRRIPKSCLLYTSPSPRD